MRYSTSLRPWVSRRIEEIGTADLVIGVPCYNNQSTIEHVIRVVSRGLQQHFTELRPLIVISDGGSTDDTREVAKEIAVDPYVEKIVQIYRGPPGKGSALRSIFEIADFLKVRACAVVDSDLRSITPDWVRFLLQPVLDGQVEFVAPLYRRYKYDGTITNNIVYTLTRALFGKRIRQPIGGDFGFSNRMAHYYATEADWESDVARFGIDVWMTISAITQNVAIGQSHLGAKVHDVKDPGESLGPMFRQVIFTLFLLMDQYQDYWSQVTASEGVPSFGALSSMEPAPFEIDSARMIRIYKEGFEHFGSFWEKVVQPESYARLKALYESKDDDFYLATETWVKLVYDFSATFHAWTRHRRQLVDTMSPLYYARVASFVIRTRDLSSLEAEEVIEDQARQFEQLKPYLVRAWQLADATVAP